MIDLDWYSENNRDWEVRFDKAGVRRVTEVLELENAAYNRFVSHFSGVNLLTASYTARSDQGVLFHCRPIDCMVDDVLGLSMYEPRDHPELTYEGLEHSFSEYGRWLDGKY